ncbi:MAG TPA: DUF362 domain-containing protein [Candidatus Binatia bacterium]|nr:DUF362 domain-containing protein [Candidatus Binatia bacterium]
MRTSRVAVVSRPDLRYPSVVPFDPPNPVYAAVADLLAALGFDASRAGSPEWNPLGDLVAPGSRVVIKPNLVTSRDFHRDLTDDDLCCSSTHAAVLRPLVDLALRAVGPEGSVILLDCPLEGSDFDRTAHVLGVTPMLDQLATRIQRRIPLLDLRSFRLGRTMLLDDLRVAGRSLNAGILSPRPMPGDPRGVAVIDLGRDSAFVGHRAPANRLRFHRSHKRSPIQHHSNGRNEYSIAQTVLDADLVITVPKLKTHKKAGATICLKSVIGLSPYKYWLPHFTAGAPPHGDEYPILPSLWYRFVHQLTRFPLPGDRSGVLRAPSLTGHDEPISDGSWSGNDTIWRTVVDLNRILMYADRRGALQSTPQRRCLNIVDGIVAGEGDGPLAATPVHCGVLVGGLNAVAVDTAACGIMGVDPEVVGYLTGSRDLKTYPLIDYDKVDTILVDGALPRFAFQLPPGWESTRRHVA